MTDDTARADATSETDLPATRVRRGLGSWSGLAVGVRDRRSGKVPSETDGEAEGPGRRGRRWGPWVQVGVLVVPALVLLERGWDRRWMTDDGFINLRVVRMILGGHGPVFNVGERVEVTTSTLWVWLLAVGDVVLPMRLEWVAIVLGLACAVGGLLLATFGSSRLHRGMGATGPLVPVGALAIAAVSPVWDFSTSGLEGGLTFGWLGLSGFLLARWATRSRAGDEPRSGDGVAAEGLGLASAVVLGLGPLVRPDLTVVSTVLLVGVVAADWPTTSWAQRLRVVGAALALPLVYEVFRMGFYGSLVPNPALAKSASRGRWGTGFDYLRDFVQPYWLILPVLVLIGAVLLPTVRRAWTSGHRRGVVALTALPVAGLLEGLYVVRVGGDYMHGRLLLPAFFAMMSSVATVPVPLTLPSRSVGATRPILGSLAVGGAAVWALVVLGWVRPSESPAVDGLFSSDARQGAVRMYGDHPVTASDQGWGPDSAVAQLDPRVGLYVDGRPLDARPAAGLRTPAYAGWGIGIAGYVLGSDVHIIDMLGLGDPVVSRFELDRPRSVGHEKPMPRPWLAARITTGSVDPELLPSPALTEPLYESESDEFDGDVDAARRALECGDLRRLDESVSDPLTVGRFLSNLLAAPSQTRLQVPPDPQEAAERFC